MTLVSNTKTNITPLELECINVPNSHNTYLNIYATLKDTYVSAMMTNPKITPTTLTPIPTILMTLQFLQQNYHVTPHMSNKKHQKHYLNERT